GGPRRDRARRNDPRPPPLALSAATPARTRPWPPRAGTARSCEGLDDRRAEGGQVARVAARDQRPVGGDLLVHRVAARVADVGAQARERGERAPLDQPG